MEKPVTLSFFFLLVPLICVLLTECLAGSQRGAGQVPLGRQCCVTAPGAMDIQRRVGGLS